MKLTVLGSCGTFPGVDGACSGYLIQDGKANILIDCGNGVMSRVQRYCKIEEIDAIILSHLHYDHISDIFVFKYAIETKILKGHVFRKKKILLPATPEETAKKLYGENLFDMIHISEDLAMNIGDFRLSFARMPHLIESYAVTVMQGDKKLTYSGDMGKNEKIKEVVRDADVFLCESTLLKDNGDWRHSHHFSAGMAAEIASACNVKKLLLTHLWFEEDKQEYLKEARKYFDNSFLAEEFSSHDF